MGIEGWNCNIVIMKKHLIVIYFFLAVYTFNCCKYHNKPVCQWGIQKVFPGKKQLQLAKAIQKNDIEGIKKSLQEGASINYVGFAKITPLAWAALTDSMISYKTLLEMKPDLDGEEVQNYGILYHIIDYNLKPEYADLAIQYGANPNNDSPRGPLITLLIEPKQREILKIFLKRGVDINTKGVGGYTILHESAMWGDYDTTWYVLNHGADYKIKGDNGTSFMDIMQDGPIDKVNDQETYKTKIMDWLSKHSK